MISHKVQKNTWIIFIFFFAAIFLGITKGSVNISLDKLFLGANQQILCLRLLRIFAAALAGSGLAVCGVILQAILRNPLAEPYLLGTSSGAGLGATIAIILGANNLGVPFLAFLGAIVSIVLVYNLARQQNKIPTQSLIMTGVMVSIAISAIMVFLLSYSSNEALHGVMWWLWGSLQICDLKLVYFTAFIVITGILVIYVFAQDLNAISLGEEQAIHLGIDIEAAKKLFILISACITASLVAMCGIIGFVGLIIPHIARLIAGPNHKMLIPLSCLLGSTFMISCDVLSRTIFSPLEIPIGVITALFGAPIFITVLKLKQRVK